MILILIYFGSALRKVRDVSEGVGVGVGVCRSCRLRRGERDCIYRGSARGGGFSRCSASASGRADGCVKADAGESLRRG